LKPLSVTLPFVGGSASTKRQGDGERKRATTDNLTDDVEADFSALGTILDRHLRMGFYDCAMHEKHKVEKQLKIEAARISAEHDNAPVVIIVGGSEAANLPHTMTASCLRCLQADASVVGYLN
jgi:hypothetical protein